MHSNSVSVIIPNYNHASYLKQRIDSVLHQTFQDFEVIILDDCSIDNSREIIEQYRNNPKINQIIYNQENSGSVFKQWIKGIENSKGEYIWIAESDDYASEDFLEETVSALQNDSSLGMVFTKTTSVNAIGELIEDTFEERKKSFIELASFDNIIDKENAPLFLISNMIIENASSVLFRKKNLMAVDFKELCMYKNTGDRFTYLGIALQSKIHYISKALNFMRLHENNTTKKNVENGNIHKDRLRVLNYYFENFLASPYKKKITDFYKENYFYFINYCSYQENLELLNNIKKTNEISNQFYYLVRYYLFLFLKKKINIRILRSIYYRILLMQK